MEQKADLTTVQDMNEPYITECPYKVIWMEEKTEWLMGQYLMKI